MYILPKLEKAIGWETKQFYFANIISLTANISESGPRPTPWKWSDKKPLIPSRIIGYSHGYS